MPYQNPADAVRAAIKFEGAQASLARKVGVTPPTMRQWANGDRPVPDDRAVQIEWVTAGTVTVECLVPGNRWLRIADAAWPHPLGRPVLDFGIAQRAAAEFDLAHA